MKNGTRFIDLAAHGGCSKKAPASDLRRMLMSMSCKTSVDNSFSDSGVFAVDGNDLVSSVDIVLPMTLDPSDFGEITVSHVLSDLYAAGAFPEFALCVLGVPSGLRACEAPIVDCMVAAERKLRSEGATLIGGHTLVDQSDFFLGFSVVGKPIGKRAFKHNGARFGDDIILTKPLGTSIASLRWKVKEAKTEDHLDVLSGMKRSNKDAAFILSKHLVNACTDISGYGLLGHLYEVLVDSGVASKIDQSSLISYDTVEKLLDPYKTKQFLENRKYVDRVLTGHMSPKEADECYLFDAQVSGGLLVFLRPEKTEVVLKELNNSGYSAGKIGVVVEGSPGEIELSS